MSGLIIYGTVAALLFCMAFVTKRRIGAPILGLSAGFILSELWSEPVSSWLIRNGARLDPDFLVSIIEVSILLLPAALLMLHGGLHKSTLQRFVAAAVFTLVTLTFAVSSIERVVVAGGPTDTFSDILMTYQGLGITLGVAVAVFDLMFTKLHKPSPKKNKH